MKLSIKMIKSRGDKSEVLDKVRNIISSLIIDGPSSEEWTSQAVYECCEQD